jgi:hypothetical protein
MLQCKIWSIHFRSNGQGSRARYCSSVPCLSRGTGSQSLRMISPVTRQKSTNQSVIHSFSQSGRRPSKIARLKDTHTEHSTINTGVSVFSFLEEGADIQNLYFSLSTERKYFVQNIRPRHCSIELCRAGRAVLNSRTELIARDKRK